MIVPTLLLLTSGLLNPKGTSHTPREKPNIILIVTDDLDTRSISLLPQLQALLVQDGSMFSNFFVTTPLCCPSRASIQRGQYAHNHQVYTNEPPDGGFQKFYDLGLENSTIATWLHDGGYQTVLIGTYLVDYPGTMPQTYVPPGWDEWYARLKSPIYFNYRLNENGQVVQYGSKSEDYLTDVEARIVLDYIRRKAFDEKPFFMYLALTAPHNDLGAGGVPTPPTPAPRHKSEFAGVTAPRQPSFNETEVSDKPAWVRNRPLLNSEQIAEIDEYNRRRLQSLLAVDELIANLIDALKETNALENTYILFTSDNGFHMGEHRLPPHKTTPYEEDIRVPLILRGPGVPSGQVLDHIALNIDLASTIAELAGIQVPDFVDGHSLVPLLRGNPSVTIDWRQKFLVEFWRPWLQFPTPSYRAVRMRRYSYVEWSTGEIELYDLPTDPYQLQSQHEAVGAALLAQLSSQLDKLNQCAGPVCRAQLLDTIEWKDDNHTLPRDVALCQNYPNPFDLNTSITYFLTKSGTVEITLYNALGQRVKLLLHESRSAGRHSLQLFSRDLAEGVYFVRLEAAGHVITRKVLLVK